MLPFLRVSSITGLLSVAPKLCCPGRVSRGQYLVLAEPGSSVVAMGEDP